MRVLVTGGAGYIGSHTTKALAQAGFEPVVFDNLSAGHEWAVRWGPFVRGDVADTALLRQTLEAHRVEGVVHFAANAYVGESVHNPRKYYRNNLVNSLNLLEAMLDADVRTIVFSSSCATYGIPDQIPIDEDQPQRPVNPYGEAKLAVERALHSFGEAYGLRSLALRYFNAAGADPDGEIGEDHDPETHLVPLGILAALGRLPCLEVYGTDYPTPDGTAIRDFVHVTDLGEAHVHALQYLLDGGCSTALNLGTGVGHSVHEVVACVERIGGRTVPVRCAARRQGDPPQLVADASRARRLLGWAPRYAELPAIVETAYRWHQQHS